MLTFHNDPQIKEKYLARLKTHAAADEIIQGTRWANGKGCAIGCTLEKYDHKGFETELGIPEWLARLEDRIFEGLPNADAKNFAVDFLEAVPVGVELERVKWGFLVFVLEENAKTITQLKRSQDRKTRLLSINSGVLAVLKSANETGELDLEALKLARAAADAAAEAAFAADAYAARAAVAAAYDDAHAAAYAAATAADAAVAAVARADARREKHKLFAAELLRLLRDAK